jgi:thiamine-monophosphate kinase
MARLCDLGEFETIRRLIARAGEAGGADGVRVGPGDDAAIVRPEPGRDLVVTTDAFAAGRHWLDAWIDPEVLGARLVRANLSDVAAMAARPRWATLAMGLAPDRDHAWVAAVEAGVAATLAADGARLVGGNLTATSGEEWLALTLIGDVRENGAWLRSGARPGDLVVVTGGPGRAGAAIALIRALGESARDAAWRPLLEAWRAPGSRVDLARALAASRAVTAAIDVSDGLAGDLARLTDASGLGARLERRGFPADDALDAAARQVGVDPFALRLGPSDDYELLLAVNPRRADVAAAIAREAGVAWNVVGRFIESPDVLEWLDEEGARHAVTADGFDHFR